jgi:hypothetical protein
MQGRNGYAWLPNTNRWDLNKRAEARHCKNKALLGGLGAGQLRDGDEFVKKRPVMNHGLAQFFGAGFAAGLTIGDSVGQAVILEDKRMADGNIGGALLKVTHRIAARGHHIAQELIGFRYSASGAVHKSRLYFAPRGYKARTISGAERLDIQILDAIGALIEARFCLPPAIAGLQGAVIFSTTNLVRSFSLCRLRPNFMAPMATSAITIKLQMMIIAMLLIRNAPNFLAKSRIRVWHAATSRTQTDG